MLSSLWSAGGQYQSERSSLARRFDAANQFAARLWLLQRMALVTLLQLRRGEGHIQFAALRHGVIPISTVTVERDSPGSSGPYTSGTGVLIRSSCVAVCHLLGWAMRDPGTEV